MPRVGKGSCRWRNEFNDVRRELRNVVHDRAGDDGEAGEEGCKELLEHRLGEVSRRMAGGDLFFATYAREFGAPDFFLAFLVGDEFLQRGKRDEP